MQNDDMIWQIINNQFCSFKSTIGIDEKRKRQFCRNPYSVTGLCNKGTCPLANSKYATIREEDGKIHLYIKTIERAHTPKNLWEKILLSRNYSKALAQLDEHLAYFPQRLIHRNKQRLTKIHQYLIRMRKLKLNKNKPKLVSINRKIDQREERREVKALKAARVEKSIEKELVERLAKGTYGDIYNFPEVQYNKALEKIGTEEEELESEEEEEMEIEDEMSESGFVEYVEDFEEEDEDVSDVEDFDAFSDESEESESSSDQEELDSDDDDDDNSLSERDKQRKKRQFRSDKKSPKRSKVSKKGPRVEIEYEEETESPEREEAIAGMAW